ncbi:hypothetical protein SAMN05216565_11052 [Litchfieldia salsa]|uniref:Uncharacterized protein n=1 Tax=Litchfieldia salsa TaxID=930152 RepID=A0A1H0WBI1_9BACI|nr:hypothetical protein SAMN05216565_11052 [Litchfieldia salsa]
MKTENQIEDLLNLNRDKELPVITKIILEGDNGILYSIEPSDIGLKFATGELSYNEYKALQKDGKNKLFMYGSLSIISFVLVGWGMLFYLI